jgi:ABC-type sugar transport system permease subunit
MELVQKRIWDNNHTLSTIKSFLVWGFILTVCMLIVGFPMVILVTSIAALGAIVLQAVLPTSAVVIVAGIVFGVHLIGVTVASAILTMKGIHPHEVKWLSWLNGEASPSHVPVYASCPLTCSLTVR